MIKYRNNNHNNLEIQVCGMWEAHHDSYGAWHSSEDHPIVIPPALSSLGLPSQPQAEDPDDNEHLLTVPTSTKLVPTVPVEVAVWSLGSFRLKGVSELIKVWVA